MLSNIVSMQINKHTIFMTCLENVFSALQLILKTGLSNIQIYD